MTLLEKERIESHKKTRNVDYIGELYPVLKAADGEIIDGLERTEADWESERVLPKVKTRLQKLVARAVAHQRKNMTFQERRRLYDAMAEELIRSGDVGQPDSPYIPRESRDKPVVIDKIAKLLGISASQIARYISERYKRGTQWQKFPFQKEPKRSALEVRAEMLEVLHEKNAPFKPTRWMYAANISWNILRKHTAHLYSKGLIVTVGGGNPLYIITEKGKDIIKKYQEVKEALGE